MRAWVNAGAKLGGAAAGLCFTTLCLVALIGAAPSVEGAAPAGEWWNASHLHRQRVTLTTGSAAATAPYPIRLQLDHAALVGLNQSLASGDDLRVVYWNGTAWVELDRRLDDQSSWNSATTTIWFQTQADIPQDGTTDDYYLYYGNSSAGAPPSNWANVFLFYDDFNDGSLDAARWTCEDPFPHGHVLSSDGAFSDDGTFYPLEAWDGEAVMKLFRERLLARLIERHAISEELAHKLLKWRHPGFSAHIGEPIPSEDKKAIEDVASYLVKAPLSLKKLVYLDGQKAVVYRSKMNPALGRNFEAMDPLEWLARLADHIPDPGKHRTLAYGHYANRARGARAKEKAPLEATPAEAPKKRRCSPNWARLISKVYHADPLVCKRCRGRLAIVAYITDEVAISRILDHLALTPAPQERPPPTRELVRVPLDEEGREIQAS